MISYQSVNKTVRRYVRIFDEVWISQRNRNLIKREEPNGCSVPLIVYSKSF